MSAPPSIPRQYLDSDLYIAAYLEGFDAGVHWLSETIAETQRIAVGRALRAIDLKAAGRVCPGVAE